MTWYSYFLLCTPEAFAMIMLTLILLGISIKEKTCVDYIYFSASSPPSHHIQNMPSWFEIDDDHLDTYEVSGLTTD